MANPAVTYTFSNGTVADADEVNTNFSDLINSLTDGTKDLSISALTVAGTATLNGAVTLGNATGDDITFTGSLASGIPIKTTNTYNVGSSTLGLAGIYFGTADTDTARIISAALAADRTYSLPDAGADADFVMTAGSQTLTGHKEILGTTTNDDASAGYIGEYIEDTQTSVQNAASSGSYLELCSITLTAGDWDIAAAGTLAANSASTIDMFMAVSTTTASSSGTTISYDLIYGDGTGVSGTANNVSMAMPRKRVSISGSTTYYLNVRIDHSSGTPQWRGSMSARRIR